MNEVLEAKPKGPYLPCVSMNVGRRSHDAAESMGEIPELSLLDFAWQVSTQVCRRYL